MSNSGDIIDKFNQGIFGILGGYLGVSGGILLMRVTKI